MDNQHDRGIALEPPSFTAGSMDAVAFLTLTIATASPLGSASVAFAAPTYKQTQPMNEVLHQSAATTPGVVELYSV